MLDVDPASKVIDDYLKKLLNLSFFETFGETFIRSLTISPFIGRTGTFSGVPLFFSWSESGRSKS
jgi:hypothetical protein